MYQDAMLSFTLGTIANSTSATVSTTVLDCGAAKILFGSPEAWKMVYKAVLTADANCTIKVELLGADNNALTTNPIVIATTGVRSTADDGTTAIGTGATVTGVIPFGGQTIAKQYYGIMTTLGGTNPDCGAGAGKAYVVLDNQTNLPAARAAIPA